ncbi:tRNA wybutosine-synthesizing protein 2 [Trypanosoma grayi]|uniref:tRNA wybutosine-synthesizing protein 2 n=1 Tax=Trypanosoma grayi TaxID=71804 RepID=UPI0004F49AF7|nr:tRNA wybutosine-synthesizing protein 2 [Trypanosoma grayi]KEG13735.1 tRNA wybutosine-synthesizing protein 2 [Trypanosoma grayi]
MKGNLLQAKLVVIAIAAALLWLLRRHVRRFGWFSCPKLESVKKKNGSSSRRDRPSIAARKIDLFVERVKEQGVINDVEEIVRLFPRRFETLGHVVVVKLNPGVTRENFSHCAKAFAESFSPRIVDVVLLDTEGIEGELRKPKLGILWANDASLITAPKDSLRYALKQIEGSSCVSSDDIEMFERCTESLTFTTHVENGIRYSLDVCKVMFCSGNGTERMHFATVAARDEVVVDMFAGIGYFTLPLAMHGAVKVIHALEKNADSVAFLKYNSAQNKVSHLIRTYHGDNREVASELCGQCDRVLMGYIPSCEVFLARAVSFLRLSSRGKPTGTLHYHFLSEKKTAVDTAKQHVRAALGEDMMSSMCVAAVRIVKSYAPKRFHCVADLIFEDA